ncbi:hypothetical protein BGZ65_007323, partial [Modicella reniformis]
MVFGNVVSSPRGSLSPQQSLELANVYLEGANKAKDSDVALVLCHDTEVSLYQAKKGVKRAEDQTLREGVATAYIELGRALDSRGRQTEAQSSYKKGEKLGAKVRDQSPLAPSSDLNTTDHSLESAANNQISDSAIKMQSTSSQNQHKKDNMISTHIFAEDVLPPTLVSKLPVPDERLHDTPQLACCLSLLKASHSLDDILEPVARNWIQTVEKEEDEQERLKVLAIDVIRAYKRDELKDAKAVAEIVCLSPALDKDTFRDLLTQFYDG